MLPLLATLALIILCGVLLLYAFLPYRFHSRRYLTLINKIPGPRGVPYLGNALYLQGPHEDLIFKLIELRENYGTIFKVNILGIYEVVLYDVADIEVVLNNMQHISKSDDYLLLRPWLGDGLLTTTGEKWHYRRKALTNTFHFKILEEYIPVFNHNSQRLVKKLQNFIDDDYIIINNFVSLCTLDIICETTMGTSVDALNYGENDYIKAVQRISELFTHRQMNPYLWREFIFPLTSSGIEQKKILNILHRFTEQVIKERRMEFKECIAINSSVPRKRRLAFLDLLIEMAETTGNLSDMEIREEVDTFMFEGHDTTSTAICWALYLLGCHPDIQEKAVEELKAIFGNSDRSPTLEDLQNMKYLEKVIKESLRLYPSVPAFGRQLEVDMKIRDYTIPAGTNIIIPPYLIHRNPNIYPDPEKFDPERFSADNCKGRHPYSYLPFSAGPRNCIGQRFALLEEKTLLSQILRNFVIESLDKREELPLLIELILRPKNGIRMKLKPRIM